jgi:predicted metal-dependent hydrolase
VDPRRWQASEDYLYAIDLFNGQFYWEAHESWEGLWHAAGRKGTTAYFLKGLIKLAAAGVKHRQGTPRGVKSHACRAAELFQTVARSPEAGGDFFLGFRTADLVELADAVCRAGWPEQPPLILPHGPPRTGKQ